MKREVTIAIETGIGGGSVSVLRNASEIDFWQGTSKISKSEDLLLHVSELLAKHRIDKNEIGKIAVSKGPGSFTGVRIGIATARGLQRAFQCACVGVSVLEAMTLRAKSPGQAIAAFGLGKNEVCWQRFELSDLDFKLDLRNIEMASGAEIATMENFTTLIKNEKRAQIILTSDLFEACEKIRAAENTIDSNRLTGLSENPAKYIGLRGAQISASEEILPIYARNTRFV
jgi:tRNA threonylcarbamoyl adenosine modification protein YeaZ